MLSGDNGILNKATDAKTLTERRSIIEQAQTDVLGYQAENKATDLKKSQLQSVLEKYFKNVPDLTDMQNSEILGTKLDTLEEYGNHNIEVKEIFNGNLLEDIQTQVATADEINAKIGTVVTGYSAKDIEWQVYYADNNETFLISKTHEIPKWRYGTPIPFRGENKNIDYTGSEDVASSSYGSKWNTKWLQKCTTESTLDNAKATAYICDPDNWTDYKTGSASYAVGGPTIELLIASWNKSQESSVELNTDDVTTTGIVAGKPSELYGVLANNIKNGIYNVGSGDYWLATPGKLDNGDAGLLYVLNYQYIAPKKALTNTAFRPIVSIPTSKISISGDTVTVLP